MRPVKVQVVHPMDNVFALLVWLVFAAGVGVALLQVWSIVLLIVAAAAAARIWYRLRAIKRHLGRVLAARNEALLALGADVAAGWDACLAELEELRGAGLSDEDIRRELVLGERFDRGLALAVLEVEDLSAGMPKVPIYLRGVTEKTAAALYEAADRELSEGPGDAAEQVVYSTGCGTCSTSCLSATPYPQSANSKSYRSMTAVEVPAPLRMFQRDASGTRGRPCRVLSTSTTRNGSKSGFSLRS
ncbi:MAG: hypothetical protein OXH09_18140 [Gammaproteobacteria bacterium]|nr:hypothetical protein [Gammaproteobacteria bacterium]